jgi:microcin C transport system substrate-binding protein
MQSLGPDSKTFFASFFQKRSAVLLLLSFLYASPSAAQARDDILTLSTKPLPPAGYDHLPYVNPNAPKGGAITVSQLGDFDNLNPFILRGTAPISVFRVWQQLFKTSDIDSITAYADLATSANISPDGRTVTFHLDPRAKFSDGTPVTAQDVVWTFNTLITQGSPFYASYYAGVTKAAAPDAQTVIFTLAPGTGRDMPINLAGLYVLPEHFWKGRNFADPLLVPPVGSGPYQVQTVSYGNFITYAHVRNWWAADKPADKGMYNFDTYSEDYFQTEPVALQAFKAGQIDARIEGSAKQWASGYNFPAAHDGQVRLELVPESLPDGIYGLLMNTRRPDLSDPRIRHALTIAFDFEWMNRVLFNHAYVREHSYFSNSPMASSGLPSPAELKLLAPFRGQIPDAVFTAPYTLPVTDGSGYNLPQLEQAMALLNQAGWTVKNFKLVNAAGQQMKLEILLADQQFERIAISYAADLKLLGIDVTVRTIDAATDERRENVFDYDMTVEAYPATDFPGAEQAGYWGCAAAQTIGSNNLTGACSPAIDAMIAAETAAPDAESKLTAVHALDRLLLNGWYIIPWWDATHERLAYWQTRVDKPEIPIQMGVDFDLWWHK